MTIYEVKQKVIDAMGEIDVSKLGIVDVLSYVDSLHKLNDIKEPDPTFADTVKILTDQMSCGFANAPKPATLGDLK